MRKIIHKAAAVAAFAVVGVTATGVTAAAAADNDYPPETCTAVVNGVETVVPCDSGTDAADVAKTQVQAEAVSAAGTLPYTGNDSSLPLAEVGVGLLVVGGGALLIVKRRQGADA